MSNLTVVYGETKLVVEAGTSINDVKASMSQIFPELKNSEAVIVGQEIHFKVKAGTKGAGSVENLTVVYGETRLVVEAGTSLNDVKASMAQIFPELKNAEAVLSGSEVHFKVKAGTKGAGLTVVYGETKLVVEEGTSLDDVKASMSQIFPELRNAEATLVGSEIHFKVKAGTKGAGLTVVYGETRLAVEEGTSLADVKASMSQIFPELKNAEASLVGQEIHFKVKAGTKGAGLTVVYGDTTLAVEEGTSLNDVKASMAQIFPELKNAEAVLSGSTITFQVKAGTKGSGLTVVYGDTTLAVEAGTSLADVKASMAQIFPELKNAEAVLSGSTITFQVKAGTKGAGLTVVYGETRLAVEEGTSLNDVKASMSQIFPELKNSEAVLRGQEIHFTVKAGTKGAGLTVVYGETRLAVEEGTTLSDVKASMSQIFPELKNAEAKLVGQEIHFTVKAGTKGN
jgi:phage terminase Nu1 subunit (DNA packaging protein)